jgi:hypothetical protein
MSSSSAISLFSAQPALEQRPYSFLVSVVVHTVVIALIFLGILSAPKIRSSVLTERYSVRHLDLHSLEPEMERAASNAIHAPSVHPKASPLPKGGSQDEEPQVMRQVLDAPKVHQTLVQPDIPKPLKLPREIPLPTVVIWNAEKPQIQTVAAPVPQSPPVALAKPVIQRPNKAPRLDDIAIKPSDLPMPKQPILASTTSPIIVSGPKPTPPAPLTTAAGSAQAPSGAVISLSDFGMANGQVTLPPVNQSASSNSQGALAPGKGKEPSQAGHGNPAGAASGTGTKPGTGSAGDQRNSAQNGSGGNGPGTNNGSGQAVGGLPKTTHIVRQREGQFGAVVVGSSLKEQYPEIGDVWGGRMAYTVYLPVGLSKSWIIQYSLSRTDDPANNKIHVDAPWPYSIVRPNIEPGAIDADALMVHGFVNEAGRFEALSIAFPSEFAQAKFVLNALAQWQFRPATQNGQDVKVEVLLIIPEIPE